MSMLLAVCVGKLRPPQCRPLLLRPRSSTRSRWSTACATTPWRRFGPWKPLPGSSSLRNSVGRVGALKGIAFFFYRRPKLSFSKVLPESRSRRSIPKCDRTPKRRFSLESYCAFLLPPTFGWPKRPQGPRQWPKALRLEEEYTGKYLARFLLIKTNKPLFIRNIAQSPHSAAL